MDYKFELFLAIVLVLFSIYYIKTGYQMIKFRKKTIVFPTNFFIWVLQRIMSKDASEKIKEHELEPRTIHKNGLISIIMGCYLIWLIILLLVSAIQRMF
jgi:hypothetical protein